MEGEILSCVCDVRQTKVKHARSGTQRMILRPVLVLSVQGLEVWAFARQHQYHTSFRMPVTGRCKTWIITVGHHPVCLPAHDHTCDSVTNTRSALMHNYSRSQLRSNLPSCDANMQFVCTFECTCIHMCNVCMQHICLWNSTIISNLWIAYAVRFKCNWDLLQQLCPNLWCQPQSILWSNWGALLP